MRFVLILLALTTGCQSSAPSKTQVDAAAPEDFSKWATERIQFPPSFAPALPAGRESLLFAPGWRTAGAEDNWAYALLMEIEEPQLDAKRIAEVFDLYFDGLIGSVARNNKAFTIPEDPAQVTVEALGPNRFVGQVQTYNAFVDGAPITLHVQVTSENPTPNTTLLRIRASRQTLGPSPVWARLQQALDHLSFDESTEEFR